MNSKFQNMHKLIKSKYYQIEQIYDNIHIYQAQTLIKRLKLLPNEIVTFSSNFLIFYIENLTNLRLYDIKNDSFTQFTTNFPIEKVYFSDNFLLISQGKFSLLIDIVSKDQECIYDPIVHDFKQTFIIQIQNQLFIPKLTQNLILPFSPTLIDFNESQFAYSNGFELILGQYKLSIPLFDGKQIINLSLLKNSIICISQTFLYEISLDLQVLQTVSIQTMQMYQFKEKFENVENDLQKVQKLDMMIKNDEICAFYSQNVSQCLIFSQFSNIIVQCKSKIWSGDVSENVVILSEGEYVHEVDTYNSVCYSFVAGDHNGIVEFGQQNFGIVRVE